MQIDFNAAITDLRGRQFVVDGLDQIGTRQPDQAELPAGLDPLTLGYACYRALNTGMLDEKDWKKFTERYKLMTRLYGDNGGGVQDVSVQDVAELQKLLPKVWTPLICGKCGDLLEPPAKPDAG